jgi:endonuclease VIII
MPEGDTLFRIAAALRPSLAGRRIVAAAARQPGPRAELLVGATVEAVEARGKHLLVRFDNGLVLRTHLGMHGSWHRYARGERWQRPPARARIVLETEASVAVCFDAPTVELFDARVESLHPKLSALGPDLLSAEFDDEAVAEIVRRLRAPERESLTIAEALLDQRAMAGVGNIYKSETLFVERVNPFIRLPDLPDETLGRLVLTARDLLRANAGAPAATGTPARAGAGAAAGPRTTIPPGVGRRSPADRLWVYDRAGRPCRRCGTIVERRSGGEFERTTYWCPTCQGVEERR